MTSEQARILLVMISPKEPPNLNRIFRKVFRIASDLHITIDAVIDAWKTLEEIAYPLQGTQPNGQKNPQPTAEETYEQANEEAYRLDQEQVARTDELFHP